MATGNFMDIMKGWTGEAVTIINPQSYSVSKITDGISFESYAATLMEVADDYIVITFSHKKKEEEQPVSQFIPARWIKRVSTWGDQKYIQI